MKSTIYPLVKVRSEEEDHRNTFRKDDATNSDDAESGVWKSKLPATESIINFHDTKHQAASTNVARYTNNPELSDKKKLDCYESEKRAHAFMKDELMGRCHTRLATDPATAKMTPDDKRDDLGFFGFNDVNHCLNTL